MSGELDTSISVATCAFKLNSADIPRCSHATATMDWMTEYRLDEFLEEFEAVLKKMILNGYNALSQLTTVPVSTTPFATLPRISASKAVDLTFRNPIGSRVWIGVYCSNSDPQALSGSAETWSYPCGNKMCSDQSLKEGSFAVQTRANLWRAYLMAYMNYTDGSYQSIAFTKPSAVGGVGIQASVSTSESGSSVDFYFSIPVPLDCR